MVDVSDIFYVCLLGEGKGESEALGGRGWGVGFLENPRRGGLQEGQRGREAVCGELGNWGGGGGLTFFLSGPKCPPNKTWPVFTKGRFRPYY